MPVSFIKGKGTVMGTLFEGAALGRCRFLSFFEEPPPLSVPADGTSGYGQS